jgi:hypothetical protein
MQHHIKNIFRCFMVVSQSFILYNIVHLRNELVYTNDLKLIDLRNRDYYR